MMSLAMLRAFTITGTPGSANANTTVKLATDLATSGTTELYFYWEVDGSPMSGYGSGTFALRLSSEANVTEGTSAAANILEVYWQDEWTPLVSADVTTDDKFIAGETYILDLSDESLTDITVGISSALDDPSGNLTSVLTSSGTPGSDSATLTFEPTEAMTGIRYMSMLRMQMV